MKNTILCKAYTFAIFAGINLVNLFSTSALAETLPGGWTIDEFPSSCLFWGLTLNDKGARFLISHHEENLDIDFAAFITKRTLQYSKGWVAIQVDEQNPIEAILHEKDRAKFGDKTTKKLINQFRAGSTVVVTMPYGRSTETLKQSLYGFTRAHERYERCKDRL